MLETAADRHVSCDELGIDWRALRVLVDDDGYVVASTAVVGQVGEYSRDLLDGRIAHEECGNFLIAQRFPETIRANQHTVVGQQGAAGQGRIEALLEANRLHEPAASCVESSLLRGQQSGAHQLGNPRMIASDLFLTG